jgi:hypothetical protein
VPLDDLYDAYCKDGVSRTPSGWGWRVVSPQGLCGAVFMQLGIRNSSAVTLLSLPDALRGLCTEGEKTLLYDMVVAYAKHLDPDLNLQLESKDPAVARVQQSMDDASIGDGSPAPSSTHSTAASLSCSSQTGSSRAPAAFKTSTAPTPSNTGLDDDEDSATGRTFSKQDEEDLRTALMSLQNDPDALKRTAEQTRTVESAHVTEGAILCEPFFRICNTYGHIASPNAFLALQSVLTGCILMHMPIGSEENAPRWYDARSRVACMRLAHWLCVPMATFAALEASLFHTIEPSLAADASKEQLHSYHSFTSAWLKVGAAAVGGGVLMAVTAGLAAPAIVAGLGNIAGMTGGTGVLLACGVSLREWDPVHVTPIADMHVPRGGSRCSNQAVPLAPVAAHHC